HLTTLTTALPLADPPTRDTAARIEATLKALITHTSPHTSAAHTAWTTPAVLTTDQPAPHTPPGSSPTAQRALRHLHRLDACLLTLADTLGMPAAPKHPSRTADRQK
ncbi:hypothetical protein, partial [Streptomyces sp. NPDC003032]